jgi:hypothetical protein
VSDLCIKSLPISRIQEYGLTWIQPVEFRIHEHEPLLFGDLAVLVGIHEEQHLLYLFRSEHLLIRRLR